MWGTNIEQEQEKRMNEMRERKWNKKKNIENDY